MRSLSARFAVFLLSMAAIASSGFAADALFRSDSLLPITLNGPFKLIDKERDKEQEYTGSLSYSEADGRRVTLDAKFSVRGNFRLRKDVCSHAQLWVNLKKSQVKDTLFDKQDKLKLVVQCKDSDRYAEYLAREHQAYLMYEELTDLSLATRLVNVTYADSENGDSRTQLGFFIQHQDRLAKQRDMLVYKEISAEKARLDLQQSTLVSLFMLLLANTDYSLVAAAPGENCCHNVKLLESADGVLHPLPYDYDSTGYVNAPYAEPAAGIGQRNVRQRMYRGYCAPAAMLSDAVARVQGKREQIYAIVDDETYVSNKSIRGTRKYVDQFFAVLDNEKKFEREVVGACR